MTLQPYGTRQCQKCGLDPRVEAEAPWCRHHDLGDGIESLRWTCKRCGFIWETAIWTPEVEQANLPASDREMAAMSMIRTIAQECDIAAQVVREYAAALKAAGKGQQANRVYKAYMRATEAAGRVLR